jgi:tetratricopeptide (TPR) repeat protein
MLHHRLPARIVVAALASLLLSGSAHAQMGRVNGVVKGEDGQAIKGATITAENRNVGMTLTATTDDKGRFNIIGLRSGEWRFYAQAPGYAPQGGAMLVRLGSPNPPLAFQLARSGVAYFGALGGITAKDLQASIGEADRLFNEGRWDEAIGAYRAVLNRAPVLTAIHLQVAAAYRQKKDYDNALAVYNNLLTAEPGSMIAPVEIARTWMERGDPARAEQALAGIASQAAATREVFYTLGEIKLGAQDHASAAAWFQKASTADPNWAKPLLQLAQVALARGDRAEAARLLARAAEVDPTAPEAATAKSTLASLQ